MMTVTTALVGTRLRRALLALAAGGHVRLREGADRIVVTVVPSPDAPSRPVYVVAIDTAEWGPWTKGEEVADVRMTGRGLYALMHRLGVDLGALASAIDGALS